MTETGRISFTLNEWAELKRSIIPDRNYSDRVSIGFTLRLSVVLSSYGDYHYVIRELDQLEGLGNYSLTKPAQQFKGKPLFPFWHKHFCTPHHLVRNAGSHLGIEYGGYDRLDRMINEVATSHGHTTDEWQGAIAYRFMMDMYSERQAKGTFTGDWIVFAKYQGVNYYLDIALHSESNDDEELFQKVSASSKTEFPFLFGKG